MSARELADYVTDQLSGLEGIRRTPMMGGYIFYINNRIFGGIYEPGVMVKITEASRRAMPDAEPMPPYEGAKPMLRVTNEQIEDSGLLLRLLDAMLPELPAAKKK